MKYIQDETEDEDEEILCNKCRSSLQNAGSDSIYCQTELDANEMEALYARLESLENRSSKQVKEIHNLVEENFDLKAKHSEYAPIKGKVRKLESQNSVLKEKSIDIRRENDMLVEKIQTGLDTIEKEIKNTKKTLGETINSLEDRGLSANECKMTWINNPKD